METRTIRIPKDLSTEDLRYYTAMPINFENKLDKEVWKIYMESINRICKKYETPSFWNIFRYIPPVLLFYESSGFENEIVKCIEIINLELKSKGIKILDLRKTGYMEMVIEISN
ncbi:hypothetical protein A0H76_2686 [Hepatospora eriocheir]|uniref:Golgin subfamily A member 7/ERF4 domain-containing protein n=1 Tax=Hepatospora eriocheir TaxID=1081669 RepID=A0A1X0QF01_9MICR|nr:hypothetical protein A0H76_2686 [Hepatospora eriocheir]